MKKITDFLALIILIAILILAIAWLFTIYIGRNRYILPPSAACGTNLNGLGKAIMTYGLDNQNLYPDPYEWCDLLILHVDTGPISLICKGSDAIVGESSYAMNINLRGKKIEEIEPNVVVLFETDYDRTGERDFPAGNRLFYQEFSNSRKDTLLKDPNSKVYQGRWNQAGGPEILTASHHRGEGSNILFNNGCVLFVEKKDFNDLNWGESKDTNSMAIDLFQKLIRNPAASAICRKNMSDLHKGMYYYSYENDDLFPDPNNWCDILILYADLGPRSLFCRDSDAIVGESSYAINSNLKGKKFNSVNGDIVLLFETDYGRHGERDFTAAKRFFYQELLQTRSLVSLKEPDNKVYKDRWNQEGGLEILTADHHEGKGANILFADGTVRFVEKKDFKKLNWGDDNENTNIE